MIPPPTMIAVFFTLDDYTPRPGCLCSVARFDHTGLDRGISSLWNASTSSTHIPAASRPGW